MATKYLTKDLKIEIDENGNRINKLEQGAVILVERTGNNKTSIDELKTKTDQLENVVIKSGFAISIGTWVVGAFGISVIALIWSLITGQANLVFP